MKALFISIVIATSTLGVQAHPNEVMTDQMQDVKRVEIAHSEIPEEARMDIIDKYHGAKIIKAYKEMSGGELLGYMVTIQKGPEEWDVRYDKSGNPLNKVKPK